MRTASRRGFTSAAQSAYPPTRGGTTIVALFKRIVGKAAGVVRINLLRQQSVRHSPYYRQLLVALRGAKFGGSYKVRSELLKGAVSAFRSTAARTSPHATRSAYSQLNKASVSFARGTLSGLGPRPSCGPLALSPLKGGMGLQTARQFSSGGARVFDNLIVNAPLALRLVGDEVEAKAKVAAQKRNVHSHNASASASMGPRRTGSTFSGANLARNALRFATHKNQHPTQRIPSDCEAAASVGETHEANEGDWHAELSTYFEFPTLALASAACETVVVRIRLIDPLYVALGGRDPTPATDDAEARIFDRAFWLDATTALEYEHRRYLRAKALLRALWTSHSAHIGRLDLSSDAVWTVTLTGPTPDEVWAILNAQCAFPFDQWCTIDHTSETHTPLDAELSATHPVADVDAHSDSDLQREPEPDWASQSASTSDLLMSLPSLLSSSSSSEAACSQV